MLHAHSNHRGIMFADSSFEGDNAVYMWRNADGSIAQLTGSAETVTARFKDDMDAGKDPKTEKLKNRMVWRFLGTTLAFPVVVGVLGGHVAWTVGAALFSLVAAFPLYALLTMGIDGYLETGAFEQFKRNHGAEHTVIAHAVRGKKKGFAPEDLRTAGWVDPECGSVYMATLVMWAAIAALAVANVASLGPLVVLGIALGSFVLLMLNIWFNPANPLKRFQRRTTARPTDRELELASACYQEFVRVTEGRIG